MVAVDGDRPPPEEPPRVRESRVDRVLREIVEVNPFTGRCVADKEYPARPRLHAQAGLEAQVRQLQRYIEQFEYNFLPSTFFNNCKYRSLSRILQTAREIIKEALPIRCLEAVYLGTLLTQDVHELDRFPLTFKTSFKGQICRHIVLALRHTTAAAAAPVQKQALPPQTGPVVPSQANGWSLRPAAPTARRVEAWGALGLSRKADLMYKRLGAHACLADLVDDYEA
eukprot:gene20807-32069_t